MARWKIEVMHYVEAPTEEQALAEFNELLKEGLISATVNDIEEETEDN